jgi:uncharacterized protein YggE
MEERMQKTLITVTSLVMGIALLTACSPVSRAVNNTAVGNTLPAGQNSLSLPVVQSGGAQAPAPQSTPPAATRSITVTGTGRATLTPDIAYVNIGVHTENASVGEAVSSNRTQAQKVIDALKAQGVDAKDIQTTNFSLYPQTDYGPNNEVKGTKYVVDNTVYVTVRNLDKLGSLLDVAIQSGANNINGIDFDVADRTTALSNARVAAVKNAQALATELATAAGVQLGAVQTITTDSNNTPVPVYSA